MPREVEGHVFLRVFGNEVLFLRPTDIAALLSKDRSGLLPVSLDDLLTRVSGDHDKTWTKAIPILDVSTTIPTISGFPIRLKANGSAIVDVGLKGKLDLRKFLSKSKSLNIDGQLKASATMELTGSLTLDAVVTKVGLRMRNVARSSTELTGRVQIDKGRNLNVQLDTPTERAEFFSASSKFFTLHGDREKRVSGATKETRTKTKVCTGNKMAAIFGLQLCTELHRPVLSTRSNYAEYLLNGPARIGATLYKKDRQSGYQLSATLSQGKKNGIFQLRFDTPGSKVDRKLDLDATINYPKREVNAALLLPWKQTNVTVKMTSRRSLYSAAGRVMVGKTGALYACAAELRISTSRTGKKLRPKFALSMPGRKDVRLDGTVSLYGEIPSPRSIITDLSLTGLGRTPSTLNGNLINNGQEKTLKLDLIHKRRLYSFKWVNQMTSFPRRGVSIKSELDIHTSRRRYLRLHSSLTYKKLERLELDTHAEIYKLLNKFQLHVGLSRSVRRYRTAYDLHVSVKCPALNAKIQGEVRKSSRKSTTSQLVLSYWIPEVASNQIQLKLEFQSKSRRSHHIKWAMTSILNVKSNPEYDLDIVVGLGLQQRQDELDVRVRYGNDPRDSRKRLQFNTVVKKQIRGFHKAALSYTITVDAPPLFLNKYVVRTDLNLDKDSDCWTDKGRRFQRSGPWKIKALCPSMNSYLTVESSTASLRNVTILFDHEQGPLWIKNKIEVLDGRFNNSTMNSESGKDILAESNLNVHWGNNTAEATCTLDIQTWEHPVTANANANVSTLPYAGDAVVLWSPNKTISAGWVVDRLQWDDFAMKVKAESTFHEFLDSTLELSGYWIEKDEVFKIMPRVVVTYGENKTLILNGSLLTSDIASHAEFCLLSPFKTHRNVTLFSFYNAHDLKDVKGKVQIEIDKTLKINSDVNLDRIDYDNFRLSGIVARPLPSGLWQTKSNITIKHVSTELRDRFETNAVLKHKEKAIELQNKISVPHRSKMEYSLSLKTPLKNYKTVGGQVGFQRGFNNFTAHAGCIVGNQLQAESKMESRNFRKDKAFKSFLNITLPSRGTVAHNLALQHNEEGSEIITGDVYGFKMDAKRPRSLIAVKVESEVYYPGRRVTLKLTGANKPEKRGGQLEVNLNADRKSCGAKCLISLKSLLIRKTSGETTRFWTKLDLTTPFTNFAKLGLHTMYLTNSSQHYMEGSFFWGVRKKKKATGTFRVETPLGWDSIHTKCVIKTPLVRYQHIGSEISHQIDPEMVSMMNTVFGFVGGNNQVSTDGRVIRQNRNERDYKFSSRWDSNTRLFSKTLTMNVEHYEDKEKVLSSYSFVHDRNVYSCVVNATLQAPYGLRDVHSSGDVLVKTPGNEITATWKHNNSMSKSNSSLHYDWDSKKTILGDRKIKALTSYRKSPAIKEHVSSTSSTPSLSFTPLPSSTLSTLQPSSSLTAFLPSWVRGFWGSKTSKSITTRAILSTPAPQTSFDRMGNSHELSALVDLGHDNLYSLNSELDLRSQPIVFSVDMDTPIEDLQHLKAQMTHSGEGFTDFRTSGFFMSPKTGMVSASALSDTRALSNSSVEATLKADELLPRKMNDWKFKITTLKDVEEFKCNTKMHWTQDQKITLDVGMKKQPTWYMTPHLLHVNISSPFKKFRELRVLAEFSLRPNVTSHSQRIGEVELTLQQDQSADFHFRYQNSGSKLVTVKVRRPWTANLIGEALTLPQDGGRLLNISWQCLQVDLRCPANGLDLKAVSHLEVTPEQLGAKVKLAYLDMKGFSKMASLSGEIHKLRKDLKLLINTQNSGLQLTAGLQKGLALRRYSNLDPLFQFPPHNITQLLTLGTGCASPVSEISNEMRTVSEELVTAFYDIGELITSEAQNIWTQHNGKSSTSDLDVKTEEQEDSSDNGVSLALVQSPDPQQDMRTQQDGSDDDDEGDNNHWWFWKPF
ncbi:apolipophorin [Elysia marginata]|uniref:Apolipophorin n=1 Tax=Elysia marginata TaxID=1093978 RepID=A0AAV4EI26_9GAST|nr:apolipophorin [Elysia marginata]